MDALVGLVSAPRWYPNTVNIPAGNAIQQVAGQRPGRVTIAIENTGANDCQITNVADTNAPAITLAAGAAMGIDTEGEVYAYGAAVTTLQTIETAFPVGGGKQGPMPRYFDAVKPGH